jgi:hypothetical protein
MLRLHARQINRNVSVAVPMIAVIDEMDNSHSDQNTTRSSEILSRFLRPSVGYPD